MKTVGKIAVCQEPGQKKNSRQTHILQTVKKSSWQAHILQKADLWTLENTYFAESFFCRQFSSWLSAKLFFAVTKKKKAIDKVLSSRQCRCFQ
jgi:hypothetical protein